MSRRLLLADDSVTIQKVIEITLSDKDYILSVASNGDEALQMATNELPDLILADVFMPGLNGYELCEAIRKNSSLKDVPVLLLAGTFEPFDEAKSRSVGANDWIVKPFSSQGLVDKVEELLAHVPVAEEWQASPTQTPGDQDILQALEEVVASQSTAQPAPVAPIEVDVAPRLEPVEEETVATNGAEELAPFDFSIEEPVAEPAVEVETTTDPFADPFAESPASPVNAASETPIDDAFSSPSETPAELPPLEDFSFSSTPEAQPAPQAVEETVEAPAEEFSFEAPTEAPAEEFSFETSVEAPVAAPIEEFSFEAPSFDEQPVEDLTVEEPRADFVAEDTAEEIVIESTPVGGFQAPVEPASDGIIDLKEADIAEEGAYGATPERVEKRVAFLSDEQLTEIVERVAGAVIERLAAPVLEQVVWEVVPDLAESMVREEMAKIKPDA